MTAQRRQLLSGEFWITVSPKGSLCFGDLAYRREVASFAGSDVYCGATEYKC
jgi:hypothetical protein